MSVLAEVTPNNFKIVDARTMRLQAKLLLGEDITDVIERIAFFHKEPISKTLTRIVLESREYQLEIGVFHVAE